MREKQTDSRLLFLLLTFLFASLAVIEVSAISPEAIQIRNRARTFVSRMMCILVGVAPYAALILVAAGAIWWIGGADDPGQRTMAKRTVIDAIIGLICILVLEMIAETFNAGCPTFP